MLRLWISWGDLWDLTVSAIENGGFGREWMEKMHSPARQRVRRSRLGRWLSARRVRRFVQQVQ